MKLTTLTWVRDFTLIVLSKLVEILFRVILLILPLGIYMLVIQSRSKASSVSNLSIYTNEKSAWQHVFPGFILVSANKEGLKELVSKINNAFQGFIEKNKYTLSFLLAASIVAIMILMYIK